ncbi:hypothetical protein IFM89_008134 [Coptis chinensis]|uniref:Uncharacterized protein n=1 Tax=Coptis chinensis TaxID=261450 RepID=A0A835IU84_9MAGN|nr:hypothetical protein IFM89_008134 [Coptis chinensis]
MEGRHSSRNLNGNQHASSFPSLGDSANAVHGHDDDQVVDMQIDMLGGKEVGSIDVASRVKSNLPIETSIAAPNSHEVKREPTSDLDAPPGFSRRVTSNAADKGPLAISRVQSNLPVQTSNAAIHLHVVKREPTSDLDTPPGFSKCATSNVADKGPLAMLLVRTPVAQDLDVPPGFSTPNKLNASDSPSKVIRKTSNRFMTLSSPLFSLICVI